MCNDYRNRKSVRRLVEVFSEIKIPLRFSNGIPNIEPRDDIKITERAPIIVPDGNGTRLEIMRWSWPSPKRAPVFNSAQRTGHLNAQSAVSFRRTASMSSRRPATRNQSARTNGCSR
jgi:putative SOS response-associated peptidase YedK